MKIPEKREHIFPHSKVVKRWKRTRKMPSVGSRPGPSTARIATAATHMLAASPKRHRTFPSAHHHPYAIEIADLCGTGGQRLLSSRVRLTPTEAFGRRSHAILWRSIKHKSKGTVKGKGGTAVLGLADVMSSSNEDHMSSSNEDHPTINIVSTMFVFLLLH